MRCRVCVAWAHRPAHSCGVFVAVWQERAFFVVCVVGKVSASVSIHLTVVQEAIASE